MPDMGGGGSSGSETCDRLRVDKPAGCDQVVAMPSGADYGEGEYPSGSGLAKAIAVLKNSNTPAWLRNRLNDALARHTAGIAHGWFNGGISGLNKILVYEIEHICKDIYDQSPNSAAYNSCISSLERLGEEASGDYGFFTWLQDRIELNELGWIPPVGLLSFVIDVIDSFEPDNSLTIRAEIVDEAAKCAAWWKAGLENGCFHE